MRSPPVKTWNGGRSSSFAAVVALYRHLNRVQELRVDEAKATADALVKAAESMEQLRREGRAAEP